ncbi:hypothetical protein ACFL7M_10765 [Thermodesulfobacteriota bacterium]
MIAQVTLTPSESKKLISKAVVKMEVIKKALKNGLIVLHPSSSTYFMVEEITGHKPPSNAWVCGVIVPRGACVEMGTFMEPHTQDADSEKSKTDSVPEGPGRFPFSWGIRKGEYAPQESLFSLLEEMGPGDVYLKGVNAIDVDGNVGVLWGNVNKGGTFGVVTAAQRKKKFNIIYPTGLEKLIPISIKDAAKEAKRFQYDYGMGLPCGLFPCKGTVITELNAIEILSGATAIPISAGGLGGAEGAITLVVKGRKAQVNKAIAYIEASKGARLPEVRLNNCLDCTPSASPCPFPIKDKHWD